MKTLKNKLVLLLGVLSVLPIFVIAFVNYYLSSHSQYKQIKESLQTTARIKEAALDQHLYSIVLQAKQLATGNELISFGRDHIQGNKRGDSYNRAFASLKQFQEIHWGVYHHIIVTDIRGNVILSPWHKNPGSNHLGQNFSNSAFFQKSLKSHQITDFFGFSEKDHFHQLIFYPVIDPVNSKTLAVLVFEIEIDYIQKLLQANFSLGETGHIYLSTLKGEVVVKLKKDFRGVIKHPGIQTAIQSGLAAGEFVNDLGREVEGVYIKGKYPWVLVLEMDQSEIFRSIRINLMVTIAIILIAFLIVSFLIFISSNKFMQPVESMQQRFKELDQGDGDLTIRIKTNSNVQELDLLASLINSFISKIANLVTQISSVAKNASNSARELTLYSNDLNESAQSISSSVEQSSAALEQLAASIENIALIIEKNAISVSNNSQNLNEINNSLKSSDENLQQLSNLSRATFAKSRDSDRAIKEVNSAMDSIRSTGTQVTDILTVINEISEHTNLLSLNASIEAARAGDEGRGFAVVAQEISKLADKTASSVGSIQELIEQTNQDLATGVNRVEEASTLQNEMVENIQSVDQLAEKITGAVTEQSKKIMTMNQDFAKMSDTSSMINDMTREQKSATLEINQSIQEISTSTGGFAKLSAELKKLADDIRAQTTELDASLGNFKIN